MGAFDTDRKDESGIVERSRLLRQTQQVQVEKMTGKSVAMHRNQ